MKKWKIVICTKVVSFNHSEIKVGNIFKGRLKSDVVIGESLMTDAGNTSGVLQIEETEDSDNFIVTTQTSVYFVQVI